MAAPDAEVWKAEIAAAGIPRRHRWIVGAVRRILFPFVRPWFFYVLDRIAEARAGAPGPPPAGHAGRPSYAQSGEDLILEFVLDRLEVPWEQVAYVDIGAAVPDGHNNTYLLYRRGGRGLLVEADPKYVGQYAAVRPEDRVLSAAVVPQRMRAKGSIEFHLAHDAGWSSVNRDHLALAEQLGKGGVRETIVAPTRTINEVLADCAGRPLHVLSIDAEGIDAELVAELDFGRVRPWLLVIEMSHGDGGALRSLLDERGYEHYASTYINSVFLDRGVLEKLKSRF